MKKSGFWQKLLVVMLAILLAGVSCMPVVSTYALSGELLDKYANNNILFYDPTGGFGGCNNVGGGNNQNYAGATIYSEAQLEAIKANMPFYQKAAEAYGFPWQILAVIHTREHGLMRSNPDNGQGVYQLFTYTDGGTNGNAFKPAGPISDEEFQRQTDIAASVVNGKAAGLDLSTDEGVKKLFFKYNSASSAYVKQAINLGFSESEAANGEGSPYVMNRYDERRDPTVEPTKSNGTWGQIKTDGGEMKYPANFDFGAYVQYMALGGSVNDCVAGGLVSGGMNLEQAQEFMQYYIDAAVKIEGNRDNFVLDGINFNKYSSCSSALNNCVAFTRWFVGKYTTVGTNVTSTDGGGMAAKLINTYGFQDGGHTPRPYAIFSWRETKNTVKGHTGIVLGVDEARGKIIIGEAMCGPKYTVRNIGAHEKDLATWSGDKYEYAYPDAFLSGEL